MYHLAGRQRSQSSICQATRHSLQSRSCFIKSSFSSSHSHQSSFCCGKREGRDVAKCPSATTHAVRRLCPPLVFYRHKSSSDCRRLSVAAKILISELAPPVYNGEQSTIDHSHCKVTLESETRRLLRLLHPENSDNSNSSVISTTTIGDFNSVMEAWAKLSDQSCSRLYAAEQADSILKALEAQYDRLALSKKNNGGWALVPNAVSYNLVCHAYAMSDSGRDGALRSQAILQRMMERCQRHSAGHCKKISRRPPEPTTITFNTVIHAWTKSKELDAGTRAEKVFVMMERWLYDCRANRGLHAWCKGAVPNVRLFSGVIDAWANSGADTAPERAMAILEHLIEKRKRETVVKYGVDDPKWVITPDVIVFNSVINTWAKCRRGRAGAEKAQEVFYLLESLNESGDLGVTDENDYVGLKPTTITLSLILEAWTNAVSDEGEYAAQRAEEILEKMQHLYVQGYDVKPNCISFTSCINAWARCKGVPGAAKHAEAILSRQLELYATDKDLKPNTTTFNSVISAYARSSLPDSVQRAEAVLTRLEEFGMSDTISYNAVLDAYAKKGTTRGIIQKVLKILDRMTKSRNLKPNSITYNTAIDALARSREHGSTLLAKQLLFEMIRLSEEDPNVRPNAISFTSTLNAFSMRPDARHLEEAHEIFQKMMDMTTGQRGLFKPDAFAYTVFLNVCANTVGDSREKRHALKIALETFEKLKQQQHQQQHDCGASPNQHTYSALIKACVRLSWNKSERERLLEHVFVQCCQDGQVSKSNLDQFQQHATFLIKKKLLERCTRTTTGTGSSYNEIYKVPPEWCANIRKTNRPI